MFYFYKLLGRKFKSPISLFSESKVWAYNFRTDKIICKTNGNGDKGIFPSVFSEKNFHLHPAHRGNTNSSNNFFFSLMPRLAPN